MAIVTQLNEEVLRESRSAAPDKKDIQSGLGSTFVPGKTRSHAASATIDSDEAYGGFVHTNSAAVTLTLPAALPGMHVRFYALNASVITVDPNGTELLQFGSKGAGDSIANTTTPIVGDYLELVCVTDGEWLVTGQDGDWA